MCIYCGGELPAIRRSNKRYCSMECYDKARTPRDAAVKASIMQRDKQQAMSAYGGHCACCGEPELVFLALDHLDDNGAEHRRQLKAQGINGNGLYRWLRQQGYPVGYQVLCFNCNWAKSHGGCPHAAPIFLKVVA